MQVSLLNAEIAKKNAEKIECNTDQNSQYKSAYNSCDNSIFSYIFDICCFTRYPTIIPE